jgi:hypothetical protein
MNIIDNRRGLAAYTYIHIHTPMRQDTAIGSRVTGDNHTLRNDMAQLNDIVFF